MMEEAIREALKVLREGGIILYPTDTVWGIGCDATHAGAVGKIYALKRSVDKKGMIVLVDGMDRAARYTGRAPDVAWQLFELANKPLTLILPGACGIAENLIPEEGTLGIRIPRHEFCERLLKKLGRPLVSTSANISGEPAPLNHDDIAKEIFAGVDYAVDPAWEGKPTHRPSSILRLDESGRIEVVRE